LLSGCHAPAPSADLPRDQRIVVLFPEPIEGSLDPRLDTRAWPTKVGQLLFEGLVDTHDDALEPRPALAERIDQPAPDTYDVTIRATARFADGTPVTSADVVATLESVRNPAFKSPFRSMYTRIRTLEAPDDRHVHIVLDGPHAPFLSDLSLGILPARSLGPDGKVTGGLVGAGPYRLYRRDGDREVVLIRNEHYWRGRPRTPYLVFRTIGDENTRLLALLGGSADLVQNATGPVLVDAMRQRPGLAVDSVPGVAYSYLGFNLRDPILKDVRVRRAIALAIDRDRLLEHKFRGTARAATGMLPAGHWAYDPDVARYDHDPDQARRLLDEAGHPDGPNGRFKLTYLTSTDKFRRNLARLIADDLRAVGIDVEVRAFELGTLLSDLKSGNFQIATLQWPDPSEPHFLSWVFASDKIPTPAEPNRGGNRGGYVNPEVDSLLEAGRTAPDRAARKRAYDRVQQILADDLPYVSLWHEDVVVVRRAGLEGFTPLPDASLFGLWQAGWR
jgi:peptide/nickel transport system substrate-binding protein